MHFIVRAVIDVVFYDVTIAASGHGKLRNLKMVIGCVLCSSGSGHDIE